MTEVHACLGVLGAPQNLQPRYTFAPTTWMGMVQPSEEGEPEPVRTHWSVILNWWKKPLKELPPTFDAPAESVAAKPIFRSAFKKRALHHSSLWLV